MGNCEILAVNLESVSFRAFVSSSSACISMFVGVVTAAVMGGGVWFERTSSMDLSAIFASSSRETEGGTTAINNCSCGGRAAINNCRTVSSAVMLILRLCRLVCAVAKYWDGRAVPKELVLKYIWSRSCWRGVVKVIVAFFKWSYASI